MTANLPDNDLLTPLLRQKWERLVEMAKGNHVSRVRESIAEIRHDSEQVEGVIHSPPGYPVLQMAARHGSIEAMQCLIELGMDVNDKTAFDMTPLHYAANVLEIEAMELLLKNGADVNAIHWRPGGYRQYFTPLDLINRFEKNYKRGCTTDLDDNEILVFADIERIKDVLYNAGAKTAEELQPEQQE